jgi:hypothetical protein
MGRRPVLGRLQHGAGRRKAQHPRGQAKTAFFRWSLDEGLRAAKPTGIARRTATSARPWQRWSDAAAPRSGLAGRNTGISQEVRGGRPVLWGRAHRGPSLLRTPSNRRVARHYNASRCRGGHRGPRGRSELCEGHEHRGRRAFRQHLDVRGARARRCIRPRWDGPTGSAGPSDRVSPVSRPIRERLEIRNVRARRCHSKRRIPSVRRGARRQRAKPRCRGRRSTRAPLGRRAPRKGRVGHGCCRHRDVLGGGAHWTRRPGRDDRDGSVRPSHHAIRGSRGI